MNTGLYGLIHSNRTSEDHWGKNCFNSSFPAALCCYMLDKQIPALYLVAKNKDGKTFSYLDEIDIRDLFGMKATLSLNDLYFDFESKYKPFERFIEGDIDGVDLVIREYKTKNYLRPLEIKLTVMPDSTTFEKPKNEWGCEMVIRPSTMEYLALSLYESTEAFREKIFSIFDESCSQISDWTNEKEVINHLLALRQGIEEFIKRFIEYQKPLVLQTIWKTKGKEPILENKAFDILIWSDMGFIQLFISKSLADAHKHITRPRRAVARLARCLWELSKTGKINPQSIYREMAYSKQNDKEFSVSGIAWRQIVDIEKLDHLTIEKSALTFIIQPGYISKLQPERRFDQTLYYSFKEETAKDEK